ncbi:hypothetical protein BC629DRAFT_1445644 [Irpex lacteus]|nr:hypothetical protein BC629DRAFT_1445644 [Irpex lacteus]
MTTNTTPGSSAGSSVGQKVKDAFQTVHGIGESLRGDTMDFMDAATGTENRGHGAAVRGQQETAVGVNNIENGRHAGTGGVGTTGYGSGGVTGTIATTTSMAPTAGLAGNVNAVGATTGGVGGGVGRVRDGLGLSK